MLPTSAYLSHVLPPLKTKPAHNAFQPTSHNCTQSLKLEPPKYSTLSTVPTIEGNSLLHDWPHLLQISIKSHDYMLAQAIHGSLIKSGSEGDLFVDNNLVNLYSKFSKMGDAQKIFDEMLVRSIVTWTTLMKGYLRNDDFESVFRIARDMCVLGETFNEHTCSVVLQACKSPEDCAFGEQIHGFVIKNGVTENVVVATSLVSMYSRSGQLSPAEKVFSGIRVKDAQSINYMIMEYGKAGLGNKAFQIFVDMLNSGLNPSDYTFTNLISACGSSSIGLHIGKQLHGMAFKYGLKCETSLGNAVITMYGQHGMVKEAEKMFVEMDMRSLISWSAILSAFVKNGYANRALEIFLNMLEIGLPLDSGCFSTVLDGCSECNNLEFGLQIHGLAIKLGDHVSDVNSGTALIDLYAKCGSLQSARAIFARLPNKNIASFNAILIGYLNSKVINDEDPMVYFSKLRFNGVRPDGVTFSRFLSLSANQACLVSGKSLHAYTIKVGVEDDTVVGNAAITMYAKCGSIQDAFQIFKSKDHDCVTWNAIISAYALHGEGNKALSLFEDMKEEGFTPDAITILAVLQACSYSGLWDNGLCLFNEMEAKYGIKPVIEHYSCMIDLLGRTGNLSKAVDIINRSPFIESSLLWRTLVHACKVCGNLQLGAWASEKLLELAPSEASSYILVSNMYAKGGMLEEAAKVRTAMKDLKLVKETGSSWIEIDNEVHYFIASDKDHPESREIYANLDLLRDEIYWSCENRNNLQLVSGSL